MRNPTEPILIFSCDFDRLTELDVEQKGWFEQAAVVLPNGSVIPLSFWDPVRLAQELEFGQRHGKTYFSEPGLIVVPRVNREYMERAVLCLFKEGYFERLGDLGRGARADARAEASLPP